MDASADADEPAAAGSPAWRWWLIPAALALGFLWPGGSSPTLDPLVELALVAALVYLVDRQGDLAAVVSAAPKPTRLLAFVFVGLFVFGHLWRSDEQSYPLSHWTMYTGVPKGDVVSFEYWGTTPDGKAVEFLPQASSHTITTSLVGFDLTRKSRRIHAWEEGPGLLLESQRELRARHFEVLRALARLHNEKEGVARISSVMVTRSVLPRGAITKPRAEAAERRILWWISVDGAEQGAK